MLAAADLLELWEQGRDASPGERGLLLLRAAQPAVAADALADWSVGQRDAALLALRERAFGARVTAVASCPACEEALELEFAADDVLIADDGRAPAPAVLTIEEEAHRVTFRLPSAGDLARLGAGEAGNDPERWLLGRCIVEADEPYAADELPGNVLEAVAATMAQADPGAEIELALRCPECGTGWRSLFDVVSFLWREIEARAPQIMREVSTLAAAFGWSERDILTLSPWRRRRYLELAGA